jgi:hypothetical protein
MLWHRDILVSNANFAIFDAPYMGRPRNFGAGTEGNDRARWQDEKTPSDTLEKMLTAIGDEELEA